MFVIIPFFFKISEIYRVGTTNFPVIIYIGKEYKYLYFCAYKDLYLYIFIKICMFLGI